MFAEIEAARLAEEQRIEAERLAVLNAAITELKQDWAAYDQDVY